MSRGGVFPPPAAADTTDFSDTFLVDCISSPAKTGKANYLERRHPCLLASASRSLPQTPQARMPPLPGSLLHLATRFSSSSASQRVMKQILRIKSFTLLVWREIKEASDRCRRSPTITPKFDAAASAGPPSGPKFPGEADTVVVRVNLVRPAEQQSGELHLDAAGPWRQCRRALRRAPSGRDMSNLPSTSARSDRDGARRRSHSRWRCNDQQGTVKIAHCSLR